MLVAFVLFRETICKKKDRIIDSCTSSLKQRGITEHRGMQRVVGLVNRDGREASCSESEKGDCGLALRFCPASCFGCQGERGKVGKWKEISKGKLSGYRSGAIIYRKGAWKIEKTGSKGKRGGEGERLGVVVAPQSGRLKRGRDLRSE